MNYTSIFMDIHVNEQMLKWFPKGHPKWLQIAGSSGLLTFTLTSVYNLTENISMKLNTFVFFILYSFLISCTFQNTLSPPQDNRQTDHFCGQCDWSKMYGLWYIHRFPQWKMNMMITLHYDSAPCMIRCYIFGTALHGQLALTDVKFASLGGQTDFHSPFFSQT